MQKILVLVAIAVLVMAGCAFRQSGKEFRQITYTYSGGVAGFDQSINVTGDGLFQVMEKGKPGRSGRLTSADLRSLRQLAGSVNWTNVAEKYIDPRVADAIMEGLTVQTGKSTYRTVVGTGAQPPAELAQLLGKLKQILDTQK